MVVKRDIVTELIDKCTKYVLFYYLVDFGW